jgi:hypothetical protein
VVARETEADVQQTPSHLLRLSTEMLPERERFSALQEEFAQKILRMDLIDRGGPCPRIQVAFMPLGAVAAGAVSCTSAEWVRHNHHLKDCSDDFRLDIVATGPIQFSQVAACVRDRRCAFWTIICGHSHPSKNPRRPD